MSTISPMTADAEAGAQHDPDAPGSADTTATQRGTPARNQALKKRSLVVPVLASVTVALIGGVFALAVAGFNSLQHRFDSMQGRFDGIEHRFVSIEHRFVSIEHRFDSIEHRFDSIQHSIDTNTERLQRDIARLEAEMDARFESVNQTLLDHTERLARIETVLDIRPHPAPQ